MIEENQDEQQAYEILNKKIYFRPDLGYPSVLLLSVVRIERYHRLNIKDWNDLKEISPFVITIDIAQSFEFMLRMVHSRHIDMMTYLLQLNKYHRERWTEIKKEFYNGSA